MDRSLLHHKTLFPNAVIGGLARHAIALTFPHVMVHGVIGRVLDRINLHVTRNGADRPMTVRFVIQDDHRLFVTTIHDLVSCPIGQGGEFGCLDPGRVLHEFHPEDRVFMKPSRYAFRRYFEAGLVSLKGNRDAYFSALADVDRKSTDFELSDIFTACDAAGRRLEIAPLKDFTKPADMAVAA